MQNNYQQINGLKISSNLLSFVDNELLKGTTVSPEKFWSGFDKIVNELAPINKKLIEARKDLQKKIDDWHIKNKGNKIIIDEYKKFLKDIDYLKDEGEDFQIETENVDIEIAKISMIVAQNDEFTAIIRQNKGKFSSLIDVLKKELNVLIRLCIIKHDTRKGKNKITSSYIRQIKGVTKTIYRLTYF